MNKTEKEQFAALQERIESGKIRDQKAWKFVQEMNSFSDERLRSIAFIDGRREYSYRQIFRIWEKYAEVFTALKITERRGSRVGMTGNVSVECINAFYALNMLGVSVSMIPVEESYDEDQWFDTLCKEGITDLIIAETYAWPGLLRKVSKFKDELGLHNVIIMPTFVDGPYAAPVERLQAKLYSRIASICPDVKYMNKLIQKYETTPISRGRKTVDDAAVITHTSGTTKGIHKPIPLSDSALNAGALSLASHERFRDLVGKGRIAVTKEMTAAFSMVDMIHAPLAHGVTNVIIPSGGFNPKFHRAISEYKINILLTSSQQFELWMKFPRNAGFDFSSLKLVVLGGSYVSPDTIERINSFIEEHKGHVRAVSGYGLSEAGGACLVPDEGMETADVIGSPLPGIELRIFDESDEKFYKLEDGPRTGGLFISSEAMSGGRIDETVFFEPEMIDEKPFICTYDLVNVNEDGSISYAGRMNRFFANNDGMEFNAGIIETAVARQSGIEGCAVVPKYDKEIYDTIPVLYVQACTFGRGAVNTVKVALLEAFDGCEQFDLSQLPRECVVTPGIPYNDTGKVDIGAIIKGRVRGTAYTVEGVTEDGILTDVVFTEKETEDSGSGPDLIFGCFF